MSATTMRRTGPESRRGLTRRRLLHLAAGGSGLLLLSACGGAASPPAPTAAPKPAAEPTKPAAPAAQPAASPVAAPAGAPAGAPAASPTAQVAPAAKPSVPNLAGQSISVLQWQAFIPGADDFFKKQIQDDFMKETGARVTIEFVNADDLQPKIAAAVQSGSGPDVIQFQYGWQHIYRDGVLDVTDVAEEVKRQTGEFYPQLEAATKVQGKYLGVPHDQVGNAVHWRRSWFREVGYDKFPATYAELDQAGAKLKANGHPIGQALSNTFGDPPTWCYPMLWAYGGREIDEQGKVAINSPETVAALAEMQQAWKAAYDEAGLAWDGSSNNRSFLAEQISATLNGSSIWWVARNEKRPFFDDIAMDLLPAGPKGRALFLLNNSYAIMKYTKAPDAARAFIRWSMSDPVWLPWFEFCVGYYGGVGPRQDERAPWAKFPPEVQVFKEGGRLGRNPGWPGPWDQKAALAQSKYIVVSMFAKVVQGEQPAAVAAWAEGELKQIYT